MVRLLENLEMSPLRVLLLLAASVPAATPALGQLLVGCSLRPPDLSGEWQLQNLRERGIAGDDDARRHPL